MLIAKMFHILHYTYKLLKIFEIQPIKNSIQLSITFYYISSLVENSDYIVHFGPRHHIFIQEWNTTHLNYAKEIKCNE
jgi:hypothetical protein